jgi:glucokinase
MVNLVDIFNPEMIIVGGGMAKMGDRLLNPARRVVMERVFRLPAQAVRIVPAQLGDDAGVIGVAVFAFQQSQTGRTR